LTELTGPVAEYFRAANAHDTNALASTLAEDAVVDDEGRVHEGVEAIAAWNRNSIEKFGCSYTPLEVVVDGEETVVTTTVSGNFSRSPIDLPYKFRVRDGKIARLQIGE
jgi:hypothetical protein